MKSFLLSACAPVAFAAAILPRQSQSQDPFSGWSAPDRTYDGDEILGTFDSSSNNNDDSAPGITITDYSSSSSTSLNVTVQNLMSSLAITDIFAAVHSDRVVLFEVGKPVSNELSDFISNGDENAFSNLDSDSIYGTVTTSDTIQPGQYLNFSLPLSLPSRVSNENLPDALDDLDASITLIGRIDGLEQAFIAIDGEDVGDRRESAAATVYSTEGGFLSMHSGYVNSTVSLPSIRAAQILTLAE